MTLIVAPASLAQAVVEVPYVAVQSILYAIITFFMIQFEFTATKASACERMGG